ncbi:MAG: carbon starvation CstA family protein [Nanoarchaeota archaeon]|nr:carbon starvation CstA family protein [Nanoarchaeota archaeon]
MNSIWILLLVAVWFTLGYRFYGRFIEKRLKINDGNKTPAVTRKDDIDFSPAKKPLLIGHHFEAIAGAGPIIGPILAVSYFGWLPVVLWVSIGSVLIGAMHDYTSLIASVRNKAEGVSKIAKKTLNSKAGTLFAVMIIVTLILIVTVFSVSTAESIANKSELIFPLITINVVAIFFGYAVEKLKWDYKTLTVLSLIIIAFSIWLGIMYPIDLSFLSPIVLRNVLITIILLYAGIASVVPVWILLRPRDFISAVHLSLLLLLGMVSILLIRPEINAPAYISGPIFPLWPILFITVACGAISGFHGLVASGTTSKQLAKESHGRAVGYGGMLLEGTLAIFVTIVVIAGVKWGLGAGAQTFQTELGKGWIILFSSGYGNIVSSVGIPFITFAVASLIGASMVNQFILTTVDSSVRLSRFIISESLITKLRKRRVFVTLLILIPSWLLAVTNSYESLWRLFGSSNQLIASITMIGVSAFFISKKTNVKFIIIPAVLVLVTTLAALLYLTFRAGGYISQGNFVLAGISLSMFLLGIFVAKEGFDVLRKKKWQD